MSDRTLLSLTGTDRTDFLQGLVTNDVTRPGLSYAALLTPQGKYLVDFLVLTGADEIVLDVASSHAAGLFQRLTMYKLRADVQIAESALHVRRGTGPAPDGALPDPRHPALGWRLYGPGQDDAAGDDGTDWKALRVAHVIPETGIELTPDTYILEAGFERLNGVDFRKGCFVGQEVVARMKHKTELKKGLVQVAIEGEAAAGTAITLEDGREAGILFTRAGDKALAQLRFDRGAGPLNAGAARIRWDGDRGAQARSE
ncbi:MAG: folate-dependent protein inplicated in Fe-S cluster metabolism YgfZ [Rhodobacteraceae bacterium HLUCCA08]|nr:MAG: folate-dependent protein inplicated in Fe-S cluster metabolism YgfZ [Rhodobacteraceae bacterium HLUCCA08]